MLASDFTYPAATWRGRIQPLTLGAGADAGGTRTSTVTIGGASSLPGLAVEGEYPHPPALFMEVLDTVPDRYPPHIAAAIGDAINDPVAWAQKCVDEFGAEGICLKFLSTNPEGEARGIDEAVVTLKSILGAVGVPLIVYGSGHQATDAQLLEAVSAAAKGERLVLGAAEEDWYKSIAVAAMANSHLVIGFSNIDINLAKQIVILLADFGVGLDQIILDPLQAALGVGLEYSYSIIERIRLAALGGDKFLQLPIICDLAAASESPEASDEGTKLGERALRARNWELLTGLSALTAGADLLIVRDPAALEQLRVAIGELATGPASEPDPDTRGDA